MALNPCSECGVPQMVTSEHLWLNNGDIIHSRYKRGRMIFIETENLDPLFHGIERIIGAPIEHLIIAAGRRAYRTYFNAFVPEDIAEKVRKGEMDYEPIDAVFREVGRLDGAGRYDAAGRRYQRDDEDYDTVRIAEPYCIPMCVAGHIGAIEALTGVDQGYSYEEVSPDVIDVTSFPSPHPVELSERMHFKPYEHREGGLEFERCATCGGPRALSGYQWHEERGVILSKTNGRRMAIQGNVLLDPVFRDLEEELGDVIPRAVVEAQRTFTTGGFYTMEDITGVEDFRILLALRGLGNLEELEMKKKGMRMRLENAALPLMIVGLAQGLFEMGFSLDSSTVDWELSPEGDLEMEVKAGK